jgi:hypothetical protein
MNIFRNSGGPPSPPLSTKSIESEEHENKRKSNEAGWLRRFRSVKPKTFPTPKTDSERQSISSTTPVTTPQPDTPTGEQPFSFIRSKTTPLPFTSSNEELSQEPLSPADKYTQIPLKRKTAARKRVDRMKAFLLSSLKTEQAIYTTSTAAPPALRATPTVKNISKPPKLHYTLRHTPANPALPPLQEDILWLTLTPIAQPTRNIRAKDKPVRCQICRCDFEHGKREAAWRLHGHMGKACLVHMMCLRSGWWDRPGGCWKCEALWWHMKISELEDVGRRIVRMEGIGMGF